VNAPSSRAVFTERPVSAASAPTDDVFLFAHDDWIGARLVVEGKSGDANLAIELTRFQMAVRGPGTIPWAIDYDALEEEWLRRLLSANLDPVRSVRSLRGMAKKARDHVEHEYEPLRLALIDAARGRDLDDRQAALQARCALDLQSVIPIPPDILSLGEEHPAAARWLWENWGTTAALRRVVCHQPAPTRLLYTFFAANWTPWRAFARIASEFPTLDFRLSSKQDGL
jgi:hypothetical protein